jgi:hypothetical protein
MTCTAGRIPARICPDHGVCHACSGTAGTEHLTAAGHPTLFCATCVPPPLVPKVVKPYVVRRIVNDGPCPTCGSRRFWRCADRLMRAGSRAVPASTFRVCANCYPPLPGREVEELPEGLTHG